VTTPAAVVAPNTQLLSGVTAALPLRVTWGGSDASGIASYNLQQSKDGAAFATITLNTPTQTAITLFRAPGHTFAYRVRATDTKGNTSLYVTGPTMTLTAKQETSSTIVYTSGWSTASPTSAYGGSLKYATSATARATFTFTGRAVAWIAPRNTNRGQAEVWVDGILASTIDLFASTSQPRMTVFTRSWTTSAQHTVQIRVKATVGRPRIDVDAFVFLK
jgi:hypothetical protein